MLSHHHGIQVIVGKPQEIEDAVVVEDRFHLLLNDRPVTDMIASRDQLRELGAGFVVSEGLVRNVSKVTVEGDSIFVCSDSDFRADALPNEIGSSGGMSFSRIPTLIVSDIQITPEDVVAITREIETEMWRKTGGVHCSVLFSNGTCVVRSSDVGRHNTVDKVIGHAILNGIDLSRCVIGCTGRQPAGMVRKSAHAGIPVVISRAASTDKGIATAESAGITLVCFSRGDRFTVYTHPERIAGIMDK
ncbi:MAG: formate dehydrogenase accessory sulfurtransferase FdhD [Methanoregula sp.]|jgi:FdhD protein